jgi:hypothetical protein
MSHVTYIVLVSPKKVCKLNYQLIFPVTLTRRELAAGASAFAAARSFSTLSTILFSAMIWMKIIKSHDGE